MKNITLNIIGQSVLMNTLSEINNFNNFELKLFKDPITFMGDNANKELGIAITDFKDYNFFKENELIIPVLYLNFESKNEKEDSNNIINCPFLIKDFVDKINIIFLKSKFLNNSNIKILDYKMNINNKEISKNKIVLKLTEREIDFILFLKDSKTPQKINNILKLVWGYSADLETHTIETHVHRLRKKFLLSFKDENFIKNSKKGYFI